MINVNANEEVGEDGYRGLHPYPFPRILFIPLVILRYNKHFKTFGFQLMDKIV